MELSLSAYRSKVMGCWMGKNVGGTLGAPMEWLRQINDLSFYTQELSGEPLRAGNRQRGTSDIHAGSLGAAERHRIPRGAKSGAVNRKVTGMNNGIGQIRGLVLGAIFALAAQRGTAEIQPAPEPPAGTAIIHPEDGAVMLWVPSGWFTMGIDADGAMDLAKRLGYDHYHDFAAEEWFPERKVCVQGFFIDKYEVTVGRWKRYVDASGYEPESPRRRWPKPPREGAYDLYPVTRVLWAEAQEYASFHGKALPLEQQWEKAARGTDARLYPWGNELPTPERGAFPSTIMGPEKGKRSTYPVGSFPKGASPYGCMDMSGNVYEWTSEWHEPYPNNPERERILDYMGHTNGCLRGGSFYHADHALPAVKRFGFPPGDTYFHVGFRTAWPPPDGWFETDDYRKARAAASKRESEIEARRKTTPVAPRSF